MGTDGVQPDYIRAEILPEFFRNFWVRRMALDRRNYKALVETTTELAQKVCWAAPAQPQSLDVRVLLDAATKLASVAGCAQV